MLGTATHLAKVRDKLTTRVSTLKVSGKVAGMAEGGAELGFKEAEKRDVTKLRAAFAAFDRSKNRGLLLIDEAQVLADKRHRSLEKALRAMLDTRKDHLKVIFTGSSEDRLRTMFGAEDKAFYNWARVEPLPLLGEEFVRELTRRANAFATMENSMTRKSRRSPPITNRPEGLQRRRRQHRRATDRADLNCCFY